MSVLGDVAMSSGTVTSSYVGDLGVANVAASYNYDTQENKHVVSSNANCFQVYSYICIYIVPQRRWCQRKWEKREREDATRSLISNFYMYSRFYRNH